MSDRVQDERKRRKVRYGGPQGPGKRRRGGRELDAGMKGVLITCNMTERRCAAEAYSLLNEYADQLYGPEQLVDSNGSSSEDDDVEAALQKEVRQFNSTTDRQQRRFTALDSGANNVLFIRTHGIDPGQLVHCILKDLYASGRLKSRVILRMLPVCGSCKAFPEDMMKFLQSFLQPWFQSPRHASYQICFKSRNNSQSKRDDVIKSVAGLVNQLNPENKVDLTDPELSIIIEVIKSVCCVSVIRDYKRFRKYNLQEVAKGPASQESPQQEGTKGLANQESPQQKGTKGLANQESPQQEGTKGTSNQESPQQEGTKGLANQESPQQKGTKGLANQESPQQGVAMELPNQESPQQDVVKGLVNQESPIQEVAKGPHNQESPQQEVAKEPANQESPQQEVAKGQSNQDPNRKWEIKDTALGVGKQEVVKDLSSQKQGEQKSG